MFKDLESTGFVVIQNFLRPDEIDRCKQDHKVTATIENKNYSLLAPSAEIKEYLRPKIQTVLDLVAEHTALKVDLILDGYYFSTRNINFNWHQDHEPYYVLQQSRNYLNFYMVLDKPEINQSGVSVIPFDQLQRYIPDLMPIIENSGANSYFIDTTAPGVTDQRNDTVGGNNILPIDISTLAVSPDLAPGDLLLMRGDLIHKTQDVNTVRLSISIRCTDSTAPISLKTLMNGGEKKMRMLSNNKAYYDKILQLFGDTQDTILAKDLLKI
jgi:hypothetical protein